MERSPAAVAPHREPPAGGAPAGSRQGGRGPGAESRLAEGLTRACACQLPPARAACAVVAFLSTRGSPPRSRAQPLSPLGCCSLSGRLRVWRCRVEPGSQRSSPLLVPGILEKLLPQEFLKAYIYLRLPLKLLSRIMQGNVLLLNKVSLMKWRCSFLGIGLSLENAINVVR